MTDDTGLAAEVVAFQAAHPETLHLDAFIIDIRGNAVGTRYPAMRGAAGTT